MDPKTFRWKNYEFNAKNEWFLNQSNTLFFGAARLFFAYKSMVLVKKWTPKTPNIVPQGSGEFTAKRSAQRVLAENRNSDFLKHPAKKNYHPKTEPAELDQRFP